MRNRDDLQFVDAREIVGTTGVHRQAIGESRCGDHRIVGAGGSFAATAAKRCGHATKSARGSSIKWQGFEIGFGLLHVRLASSTVRLGARDQRSNREFGECYGGNQRLFRQELWVADTR